MTTLHQYVQEATERLSQVTDTPRLDTELLLAHALGLSRAQLLARLREGMAPPETFEALLERRLNHEPIAYITGAWEFFSMEFIARRPVLVPRPETEHLVETVLAHLSSAAPHNQPPEVLDLCTGSGCVACAIAQSAPRARVLATDTSEEAIALATENARKHGLGITFRQGNLFEALARVDGPFDIIAANPPYIAEDDWPDLSPVIRKHEDPGALLAGPDGLEVIRTLAAHAKDHLDPGGLLAFEIGAGQREAVEALLEQQGYHDIGFRHDLAHIPRIAFATVPMEP